MRIVFAVGLILSIPSILNAQQASATPVALDAYGANPMAHADMLVTLHGLPVLALVGSQAFFFSVPKYTPGWLINHRGPYLVKMLPEVVADNGRLVERGATVSVTGMVYAMSDSVADAWVASGGIAEGDRRLAVFNQWFFEAANVTVTGR